VILVEGPAELFVIPPLVKKIMKIDLDRQGVSIIPIYGVHFDVYAKLFGKLGMPKKCAIIADGDLKPSDSQSVDVDEETMISPPDLDALSNEYVGVFRCQTTFERALTIKGLLNCLSMAANECGATKLGSQLKDTHRRLVNKKYGAEEEKAVMSELRGKVLSISKRTGKARFAQIVSKHIDLAEAIPKYISDAINWLEP
jgi:putative ATP-dependent endonuclease of OLD family